MKFVAKILGRQVVSTPANEHKECWPLFVLVVGSCTLLLIFGEQVIGSTTITVRLCSEYCDLETYRISPSQHHGVSTNMHGQPLTADGT